MTGHRKRVAKRKPRVLVHRDLIVIVFMYKINRRALVYKMNSRQPLKALGVITNYTVRREIVKNKIYIPILSVRAQSDRNSIRNRRKKSLHYYNTNPRSKEIQLKIVYIFFFFYMNSDYTNRASSFSLAGICFYCTNDKTI